MRLPRVIRGGSQPLTPCLRCFEGDCRTGQERCASDLPWQHVAAVTWVMNNRLLQEGVKLLNPHLRCFGDLTSWLEQHAAELAGRKVLMYCTGGVRCERASAYLRSKGSAFQDVVQLQGKSWPVCLPLQLYLMGHLSKMRFSCRAASHLILSLPSPHPDYCLPAPVGDIGSRVWRVSAPWSVPHV